MSYCEKCNAMLEADSVFCPSCGTRVTPPPHVTPSTPTPVRVLSRNRVLMILAIVVVVLIASNVYTYMTFNDQIHKLTTEKTNLQTQVDDLTDIVNLERTTIIVNNQTVGQAAGSYTSWPVSAQYAGYLEVVVHTSTSPNTYVKVTYNSYSVDFDEELMVGGGGTAVFPILPSQDIEVRVGNKNLINSATERITVTYHY